MEKFLKDKAQKFSSAEASRDIEECAVCLDYFEVDGPRQVAQLNCSDKHIFHVDCLEKWLEDNPQCPLCREPVK